VKDLEQIAHDYVLQERSDYQLEHFVIGQHDTPQMQYRQILLEVKSLVTKIRLAELDVERIRIKMQDLSDSPLHEIKKQRLQIDIALIEDALEGARRELFFLCKLAERYPAYSAKEIEDNQAEYWEARLQRQATVDRLSVEQQVSAGNLMSLLQAGLLNREITQ
jgi:hypothetical protein